MKFAPTTSQNTTSTVQSVQEELPVLATLSPRASERAAVNTGATTAAVPAFTPTAVCFVKFK